MYDISIDLETLGNGYDAAILSIGACYFDRSTGELGESFYREITIDSALKYGTMNADTLVWWMGQSEEARQLFTGKSRLAEKLDLSLALVELSNFVGKDSCVWGNGATFDITILEHAYKRLGQTPKWNFWNVRDMRTAVDMADYRKGEIPFSGVAHNAIDDAIHQAKVIARCFSKTQALI